MKRREFLFSTILLPVSFRFGDLSEYFTSFPLQRPRLLTNGDQLSEVSARLKESDFGTKIQNETILRARKILEDSTVPLRYEDTRKVMLQTSREVLKRTEMLGVAWLLTGDKIFSDRLALEMENICAFETWNPSHFLDVAEMTTAAALAYDWCYDAFDVPLRERLRGAIIEKGLQEGLLCYEKKDFWVNVSHNWNIVCNSGMILGAIAVADTDWKLAQEVLRPALASIENGLATFYPDGAWNEGVSYWDYATQYAVFYFSTMESFFGEEVRSKIPLGFSNTASFRLHMEGPSHQVFNFGDCPPIVRISPQLLWMASRFKNQIFSNLAIQGPLGSGLLWFDRPPVPPDVANFTTDAYFSGAEIVSFRSSWDYESAIWVAIKGGSNTVNHGNLDIGTFVLDSQGVRFACDLGPDDYSLPGYFSTSQRVKYEKISTLFQNTLYAGQNQSATAKASVISYESSDFFSFAEIDMSSAYRSKMPIKRGCALVNRSLVLIRDELPIDNLEPFKWQMLTQASVEIKNKVATLTRDGKTLFALILEDGLTFALEELDLKVAGEGDVVRKISILIPNSVKSASVLFFQSWPPLELINKVTNRNLDEWPQLAKLISEG